MLHGHGIRVTVELHWCPRNEVPRLQAADEIAYQARRNRLGYSNADGELWSETIKSDMVLEIEMLVSEHSTADDPPTTSDRFRAPPAGSTPMSKKSMRRERRKARRLAAEGVATASSADGSQVPTLTPNHLVSSRGPATVDAVKGKVEEDEDSKRPMKRAKISNMKEEAINNTAGETGLDTLKGTQQHACAMPGLGGMDPQMKVFQPGWDMPGGDARAKPDAWKE
ncbi:hypothetical protein KVR01_006471 [Diaporthe batatas]|uniref:uncharacterized protein n=1 Tax=Diaporthe batatas TaxID=748121 RepID=UPI001D04CEA8|nr:uncharacterized protein KVR01_006471 [Diaporthe batatas]KAG8164553.1 hypothetical protein KVR01_006471 [Diaporthe batatas]